MKAIEGAAAEGHGRLPRPTGRRRRSVGAWEGAEKKNFELERAVGEGKFSETQSSFFLRLSSHLGLDSWSLPSETRLPRPTPHPTNGVPPSEEFPSSPKVPPPFGLPVVLRPEGGTGSGAHVEKSRRGGDRTSRGAVANLCVDDACSPRRERSTGRRERRENATLALPSPCAEPDPRPQRSTGIRTTRLVVSPGFTVTACCWVS